MNNFYNILLIAGSVLLIAALAFGMFCAWRYRSSYAANGSLKIPGQGAGGAYPTDPDAGAGGFTRIPGTAETGQIKIVDGDFEPIAPPPGFRPPSLTHLRLATRDEIHAAGILGLIADDRTDEIPADFHVEWLEKKGKFIIHKIIKRVAGVWKERPAPGK